MKKKKYQRNQRSTLQLTKFRKNFSHCTFYSIIKAKIYNGSVLFGCKRDVFVNTLSCYSTSNNITKKNIIK